jgi:threonyl-tRNA synthetase
VPEPFTPEDLERIEARMREIVGEGQRFRREELSRQDGLALFAEQPYKREIIEATEESEGAGPVVSVYRNDGFVDLCRGPQVPTTTAIAAFKLQRAAGAYWRGDESRPQLQRIYGTAATCPPPVRSTTPTTTCWPAVSSASCCSTPTPTTRAT